MMRNTVSKPHVRETQISTYFVRLLRSKHMPSFVLSEEAFPLFQWEVGKNAFQHCPHGREAKLPAAGLNSSGEGTPGGKGRGKHWVRVWSSTDGSKTPHTLLPQYPELHLNFREQPTSCPGKCVGSGSYQALGQSRGAGRGVSPDSGTSPFGCHSVPLSLGFCVCQMWRITR